VRQKPEIVHSDGASAIHSAEVRSGSDIFRCFVKAVCRVRFFTCTSTSVPFTTTLEVIVSPGRTFSVTVTDVAGTSSYQA
jgi:energy-coupling factor transporter transmembrane protein EcfT